MNDAGNLQSEIDQAKREARQAVARGDAGTALFCLQKVGRLERRLAAIEANPRPERVALDYGRRSFRINRRLVV